MLLGVHCSNLTWPGGAEALGTTLAGVARAADEGGVATLTLMDHYFQMETLGGPPEPMLEGYTSLGFVAASDQPDRARAARHRRDLPAPRPARQDRHHPRRPLAGSRDARARRRLVRAGAPRPRRPLPADQGALRAPRGDAPDRASRRGPAAARFEGTHYRLEELTLVPQPLQAGGPRILVGGTGERKTLRLVAQYADACNLFATGVDEVAHKLDVLRGHCDDVGRDYDSVTKTIIGSLNRPLDDVDAWLATMQEYADLGVSQVWVGPDAADPVGWTEQMCEKVVPRLAEITP